jgi:hypothetical protein
MEPSQGLTAQDIENGENDGPSDENSLWWYHPIFEARAKADIRRNLRELLPSDPSQNPSPVDMGGWRAEVRPRQSGARTWAERLEDAFGPGPLNRGLGPKPCPVMSSPSRSFGCVIWIDNGRVFVVRAPPSYFRPLTFAL